MDNVLITGTAPSLPSMVVTDAPSMHLIVTHMKQPPPKECDKQLFVALMDRYERDSLRYARGQRLSHDDAQDIVQEAKLKALSSMGSYEASRPFWPWFHAILKHKIADKKRRDGRRSRLCPQIEMNEDLIDDLMSVGMHDLSEEMTLALMSLPKAQEKILRMVFADGMTMKQIAGVENICPTSAYHRYVDALNALRAIMDAE